MDWSTVLWAVAVPAGIVAIDVIVGLTPETWKPWGVPVGKYDGIVWTAIKKKVLKRKD